mgnify:FL=1
MSATVSTFRSYERLNPIPLDASEVHESIDGANTYLSSGKAYPGQTIKVRNVDGSFDSYVINGTEGNLTLDKLNVNTALVKNYVQPVEVLPEKKDAEQGVVYLNTSDGKGYIFNGTDFKMIFDDVEIGPVIDELKQDIDGKLSTKISYDEAKALVASVGHITRKIVDVLPPVEEASETVIYMVPKANPDEAGHQSYDEYVLVEGKFEKLGDNEIDTSNFATKDEVDASLVEAKKYAKIKADDVLGEAKAYVDGFFSSTAGTLIETLIGDTGKDENGKQIKVTDYVTNKITEALTITYVE